MKSYGTKPIKLGLIALSLLLFLMSTGGALGVVWMRQQISSTAEICSQKERELVVLQRRQVSIQSKIAEVHNPESLKLRVGTKLSVPSKKQIVWVRPSNTKVQLAANTAARPINSKNNSIL